MVELSSSWLCQQHFPLESSAFRNCMIAPIEHRQHEFLPASKNPCRVSANLDLNGFGYSGYPETGLTIEGYGSIQKSVPHSQTPLTQNQYHGEQNPLFPARVGGGEKPSTCELPSAQQKKFLIFDRSGNETRLIFSSLCPRVENLTTPLTTTCPAWNLPAEESFGACHQYLAEKQGRIIEQAWTKTPALCEESGENEIIDEISEMREDTEEINALLYSEDDNDDNDDGLEDDDCDGEDDDEVSSGHSPLAKEIRDCEKQEDQEGEKDFYYQVASLERSSKRQKGLHGGFNRMRHSPAYEDVNDGGFIDAPSERMCPTIGTKRPRKDKIHDTLRVLEGIIPGLTSKDPLVILDEAISYLKGLKYNAETMSSGDPDSSSSYEPLN
ncbi:transcription factor bHLH143-like [Chenopodium quinoa]|uniref:transcription factor bHLH143-like n=1 Tax=Chenopodium quinoa TaxID=63459 RepID=UPI000B7758AC|nr:transcription factor bHLH143-like [Chenopodium quinoa]